MTRIQEVNFNDLILLKKIGGGTFGEVHLAQSKRNLFPQNPKLAVKILKDIHQSDQFSKEIEIIKKVDDHKNVIKVLGYCNEPSKMTIIMEYVTFRVNDKEISSLHSYLQHLKSKIRQKYIDHQELQSFAIQIAKGMEHLESKSIVHCDLAARNILINSQKILKITDFGFASTDVNKCQNSTFAFRWASPEVITHRMFTHKSDVWSYGIVLYEITTLGETPYQRYDDAVVMEKIEKGRIMEKPQNTTDELYDIMKKCWNKRAYQRPSFKDLVKCLSVLNVQENPHLQFNNLNLSTDPTVGKLNFQKNIPLSPVQAVSVPAKQMSTSNNCLWNSKQNNFLLLKNVPQNKGSQHKHVTSIQKVKDPTNSPAKRTVPAKHIPISNNYLWDSTKNNFSLSRSLPQKKHPQTVSSFPKVKVPTNTSDENAAKANQLPVFHSSISGNSLMLFKNLSQHQHPQTPTSFQKVQVTKNTPAEFGRLTCNSCSENLFHVIHYKCLICVGYHLCEKCYSNNPHDGNHSFRKIIMGEASSNIYTGVECGICKNDIIGTSYKCTFCKDFHLCENCTLKGYHP